MPQFNFFKLSPGGNITIILEGAPPPVALRLRTAETVLGADHLGAEQMGFGDFAAMRLEMAGGEACVNALRSFAVLLARRGLLETGLDGIMRGKAGCSGLGSPALVEVKPLPEKNNIAETEWGRLFEASVEFGLERAPDILAPRSGLNIVFLPGIVHILLERALHPMPEERAELCAAAARLRREFDLERHGAVGCVWWSGNKGAYSMHPLVWVREPESLCLENSCGSGALALSFLCGENGRRMEIMQPGGSPLIAGFSEKDGRISAFAGGTVSVIAEGTAFFAPDGST